MKIVTSHQMQQLDRLAIESGIPALDLMERAGQGVVRAIEAALLNVAGASAAVFCGKGNNGGDGFVVSRLLAGKGVKVQTWLLGSISEVKGEARINLERALGMGLKVNEIHDAGQLPASLPRDVVVDALFGTGRKGSLAELAARTINLVRSCDGLVVAVDIPSGLDCDTGAVEGPCVRADMTATMGLPKIGLLLYPGKAFAGKLHVIDIGIPPELVRGMDISVELLEKEDVRRHLPGRAPQAHKGDCGRVAIVAGSVGMTGAAALACRAALRSGAGMAILGIPQSLNDIMEIKLTETMTRPLPETPRRTLSLAARPGIEELLLWSDAIAIGPGLSQDHETQELVRTVVRNLDKPAVIDADGLNALAGHLDCLCKNRQNLVLTPHAGELSRLLGKTAAAIGEDRIETARQVARDLGLVLVLKGAPTVIGDPSGTVLINSTGNAGMATAGSGDVLTGLIAGLLAQGLGGTDAAAAGVYLHGLAGDMTSGEKGEWGLVAGDIVESIPAAILATAQSGINESLHHSGDRLAT